MTTLTQKYGALALILSCTTTADIAINKALEESIANLEIERKETESSLLQLKAKLQEVESPMYFMMNKDQERTKRRNYVSVAMAREQEILDLLQTQSGQLQEGRNFVEQCSAQLSANRAEFAMVVLKLMNRIGDYDELYYSKLVETAVADFFKATKKGNNIMEATELVGFASIIFRDVDLGGSDHTHVNGIPDIACAMHHLEIANQIYAPMRSQRLPVERCNSDVFGFAPSSLGAIRKHVNTLKPYLATELLHTRREITVSHTNLIRISERVKILRRKLLTYNLPIEDGVSVPHYTDTDFDILFPQELHRVSKVANLNEQFESEQDVGRAVGLVYPDLSLNEYVDPIDLPQYEFGLVAELNEQVQRVL
ncbi:UNVERIFIED_CONTAM: hypothetical protein HDU68_000996 [Siphonaria sp. JEL0065]|nr:hypothetical protein HDU68_000996 [Siphonaria sp. JEL0065]